MRANLNKTVVFADGQKHKIYAPVAKLLKLLPQHLRTADVMLQIAQRVE